MATRIANTAEFLALARANGVEPFSMEDVERWLDPDGNHIAQGNPAPLPDGFKVRAVWLVKCKDTVVPLRLRMDMTADEYDALPVFEWWANMVED